ncbi:MAG: hypothetical protein K6C97_07730 [Treponema sp.]|nr:hypothetical protein [Treponema sp.]
MKRVYLKIPSLFISIILISTINSSCKNASESKLEYSNQETIKESIRNKENEIAWTNAIEEEILSNPVLNDEKYTKSNINPSPDLLKINKNNNQAVYPDLNNFASLDTSLLTGKSKETVEKFAKALSTDIYVGPESFFDVKYRFNYLFFRNDLVSAWEKYFNKEFPYTEEDYKEVRKIKEENDRIIKKQKEVEEAKRAAKESGEEFSEEIKNYKAEKLTKIKEIQIFSSWIMGQPFIGPELTSVPLRFYCQEGTIDVTLYISNADNNTIYQITIDRWGSRV